MATAFTRRPPQSAAMTTAVSWRVLWPAGAVGLAVRALYVIGTFHPPAGINPLLVVSNKLPWSLLFVPVLSGAVPLTGFAHLWHRWIRRRPCRSAGVRPLARTASLL